MIEKRYYINVGDHGTFKPSADHQYDTTAQDVDALFDFLKQNAKKKLVIYFHGGLVNVHRGMETAARITKYVNRDTDAHPVCFVWETGLIETVKQNFDVIGQSAFFKKLLVKIIKVAGKKLGIELEDVIGYSKGVANLSEEEIQAELQKPEPFSDYRVNDGQKSAAVVQMNDVEDANLIELEIRSEVEEEINEEIRSDNELQRLGAEEKPADEAKLMVDAKMTNQSGNGEKGIISSLKLIKSATKITIAVIRRHIQKRDHGFYPTIIEEILREFYVGNIGSWVWGSMKDKAKDMWKKDDFSESPTTWHAGSYFLKKLVEYKNECGPLTIDLIGHSAGSIAISELLNAVRERSIDINFRNIVFMAPACRCELFKEAIIKEPFLFENFRCFTMSDEYEIKDHLIPILYPRSLLYLISGILENEEYDAYIFGLQRHTTGKKPYDTDECLKEIVHFLKTEGRVSYSVTGDTTGDGLRTMSIKHGAFDDEGEPTLDSIMYLIKQP